jgi:hypothetical protein
MQDYKASLERLLRDAEEAAVIRDRSADPEKQSLYHRLYQHYLMLAGEVEKAILQHDQPSAEKPRDRPQLPILPRTRMGL